MSYRFQLKTGISDTLRWLLRINQPTPPRSEDEITAEVERNYRWNFRVNLLDNASFMFGFSFISATTIVPLFISKLTTSPLPIGIAAVIAQSGWSLPQLFTANSVERLARKKPVVVNLGLFLERLPMIVMVTAPVIAVRAPMMALGVFILAFTWFNLGSGVVATAWQDLIARCFPVERRGRFMGTSMFVGTSLGMLGAAMSAWILKTLPFPKNFVYIFSFAAAGILISWVFLALTREPVQPVEAPRTSNRQFWAKLPEILRSDHNFRRYLIARALLAMGGMGTGFVTIAAVQRWQVSDSTVGVYTGVLLLGQTLGNLTFGFLADRFGHKLSLELGALVSLFAFLLAWLAPSAEWYYVVFAFMGIAVGAMVVSGILVIMEFCEPQRRPTYAGMANSSVGLVGVAAPLIGAWLAQMSYDWLFALSACLYIIAFVAMHWWVKEPRWAEAAVIR
ncbi:MAG: MFS transporter [Anaerolineales bacterium]|nr:MFS transporter [Anaerolineales bacterium]